MDNPDKLATLGTRGTRRRQTKQKHNTIFDLQIVHQINLMISKMILT